MVKLKNFKTFEKSNTNYYFAGQMYITDDGKGEYVNVENTDLNTGEKNYKKEYLPRYSVWAYNPQKDRFEVVDIDDDLEKLQKKYNIPDNKVYKD